jgi:hypothetical protein
MLVRDAMAEVFIAQAREHAATTGITLHGDPTFRTLSRHAEYATRDDGEVVDVGWPTDSPEHPDTNQVLLRWDWPATVGAS